MQQLSDIKDLRSIDYVIINAGVLLYPNRSTEISFDDFSFHLNTNCVGPIYVAQQLLKLNIPIGAIVFISSDSGSLQEFRAMEDGFSAYAASKAALNMAARHMDAELKRKEQKTSILCLHPGEVKTDMSNLELAWEVEGEMTPQESVRQCIETIESKTYEDSGTFWKWDNRVSNFTIATVEGVVLTYRSLSRGRNIRSLEPEISNNYDRYALMSDLCSHISHCRMDSAISHQPAEGNTRA